MTIVMQILNGVSNIQLPFGFTFGVFIVFLWSIPLLPKLFKMIF